jgi:methylmalonyl-CoA mutase C-terminal domain/subunit
MFRAPLPAAAEPRIARMPDGWESPLHAMNAQSDSKKRRPESQGRNGRKSGSIILCGPPPGGNLPVSDRLGRRLGREELLIGKMALRKIRVLVAKPGLDGHDRGAKVVARALRDAGMEVIYTGLRQTPEMIVEAALQEDVDVIGLSILSGAHGSLVPRVMRLLKEKGLATVKVLVGGIIPEADIPGLKAAGVAEVFGPGTKTADVVKAVHRALGEPQPG